MTKQIEEWVRDNKDYVGEGIASETVEEKLLEMQQQIDSLTEQNKELESFYALANELVEDYADYCSDTGALLPIEDQDSQVVIKAIQLLNKESK